MPDNEDILRAVEGLRDEWPDLFAGDTDMLARWLSTTPRDDPETVRQTANRVLDLLQQHPQAKARVSSQLGVEGDLALIMRGFEPTPTPGEEVSAGTLMVCPQDPAHYRRRIRQKGQQLICPEHGVALVPAAVLPAQE